MATDPSACCAARSCSTSTATLTASATTRRAPTPTARRHRRHLPTRARTQASARSNLVTIRSPWTNSTWSNPQQRWRRRWANWWSPAAAVALPGHGQVVVSAAEETTSAEATQRPDEARPEAPRSPSGGNVLALRPPARRRLRAFAFDPMTSRLSSRRGAVRAARAGSARRSGVGGRSRRGPALLVLAGRRGRSVGAGQRRAAAQQSDPRSHQQVVYAVAMAVIDWFERFLRWRFRWHSDDELMLVTHAFQAATPSSTRTGRRSCSATTEPNSKRRARTCSGQMM
jgi:hypothetical protein